MTPLEIISVIFTFICVVFTVKKNVLCWPFGIIGGLLYFVFLLQEHLYAAGIMQLLFAGQCFYGWLSWKKTLNCNKNFVIESFNGNEMFQAFIIFGLIFLLTAMIFLKFTDDKHPIADSFVCVMALQSNHYLSKRILQNWIGWILSDVVFIGIFVTDKLYLSAILYISFFCMATYGLITWNRDYNAQFKK